MKTFILTIFLWVSFPLISQAAGKCEIKITYHLLTGGIEKESFFPPAQNKNECEKKAKPYRANLTPNKTEKKVVKVEWKEARK